VVGKRQGGGRLLPALVVVAGLGVLAVVDSLLARGGRNRRASAAALGGGCTWAWSATSSWPSSPASRDSRSAVAPLGVLRVLDLAVAAAPAARRGTTQAGAVVASALVLLVFTATVGGRLALVAAGRQPR
jgi:hypothetical protein